MSDTPSLRLSIVIPSKDRPRLVEAAIRSALAQLPDQSEVLVVDDRSTPPLIRSLTLSDPRLRITESHNRPGASGARNWGVAQARGARILFLDDDDLLRSGYAAWVLTQSGDYGFSAIRKFSDSDPPVPSVFQASTSIPMEQLFPFRRRLGGLGFGFWIDRPAFLASGGISEDIRVNEDTEFSVRLLSAGLRGLFSPEPGVLIRKHDGAGGERGHLTHAVKARDRAANFATILDRHALWLEKHPDCRMHLRKRQVKLLAQASDWTAARRAIGRETGRRNRLLLLSLYWATRLGERIRRR